MWILKPHQKPETVGLVSLVPTTSGRRVRGISSWRQCPTPAKPPGPRDSGLHPGGCWSSTRNRWGRGAAERILGFWRCSKMFQVTLGANLGPTTKCMTYCWYFIEPWSMRLSRRQLQVSGTLGCCMRRLWPQSVHSDEFDGFNYLSTGAPSLGILVAASLSSLASASLIPLWKI